MCGGTSRDRSLTSAYSGLSPRVRGNPLAAEHSLRALRSIPACAGEPTVTWDELMTAEVYPRVCGGTKNGCASTLSGRGLSRVCGGTYPPATSTSACRGLSPRVRGNRWTTTRPARSGRSIPACAGEPPRRELPWAIPWVYPRVCGGTMIQRQCPRKRRGLSPRVRGNQETRQATRDWTRSIPACAGETFFSVLSTSPVNGLSPRVRGNRSDARWDPGGPRSIPACAGEPAAGTPE